MLFTGDSLDYDKYPNGARMMMIKPDALSNNDFFDGQMENLMRDFDMQKPVAVIAIVRQMERREKGPETICIAIPNKRYHFNANLFYKDYHKWHGTEWLLPDIDMRDFDDDETQEEIYGTNYGAQWFPYDIFVPLVGSNQEGKFVLDKLDV